MYAPAATRVRPLLRRTNKPPRADWLGAVHQPPRYERTSAPPRQQPQLPGKCSTPPVGMSAPAPRPASCSSPGHGCQDGLMQAAAGAQIRVPGRWPNAQERLWTSPSRTPARMHASPHTPGQQQIPPGLAPPSGAPNATCQQAPRAVHGLVF